MLRKLLFVMFVLGLIGARVVYDHYAPAPKGPDIIELAKEKLPQDGVAFVILFDHETDDCPTCFTEFTPFKDMLQLYPDLSFLALGVHDFEREILQYYQIPAVEAEVDAEGVRRRYGLSEGAKLFVLNRERKLVSILSMNNSKPKERERLYYSFLSGN